jgi:hypothetical protein
MKKLFLRAAVWSGLVLTLALFLGGCENPAGGDDEPTAQELADEFKTGQGTVLEKTTGTVTASDEAAVDAALAAYNALSAEAKTLLAGEKTKLDALKEKIEELKRTFAGTEALRVWLAKQPENDPDSPYGVIYTGDETPADLYAALEAAEGRYIGLDLSASGVEGFAYGTETGREYIVSLVLPDTLESTPDSDRNHPLFYGFYNLKTVRAGNLTTVGGYTFYNCTGLTEVILPKALSIGERAFEATGLTRLYLPEATDIGANAFRDCPALGEVDLPKAITIGNYAFRASHITVLNLPEATTIGTIAFGYCTVLTMVDLPNVVSLSSGAFTTCRSLTTIRLPKIPLLGRSFAETTALTTIILGDTPPIVLSNIFLNSASSQKTITFKVPAEKLDVYKAAKVTDSVDDTNTWADVIDRNNIDPEDWKTYFWDNSDDTRDNLTVTLAPIEG